MRLDEILELLDEEKEALYEEAREIAQEFWAEHFEHRRKSKRLSDRGVYGIRVKKRATGVSVLWFKGQFVKRGGETRRYSWRYIYLT